MAQPYIGEIRLFAGNYAPVGWLLCQGQIISIAENETLFALLGTTYGGDGQSTFGLPDMQGKLPVGQGQGLGLSNRIVGQQIGSETVTLTTNQIPTHTHTVNATSADASTITPGPSVLLATVPNPQGFYDAGTANPPTKAQMASQTIGEMGGGQPHSNHMPTASINYIIATAGIYPSQG
ncbi:phage tail protein [Ralstonia mojiangensis]|uniref:phage tail protein n=1 Tax=Ralstonia mojiangensis TaxID=2953895 RepID=UPI0021B241FB|nr:tail fiber protein [Ralstonia mojiangensis]MCT7326124.1 tail fiber protein [Ralstonia mojiangensis]